MKTFSMNVTNMPNNTIGFGGENGVTEVVLDFGKWAEEYGAGAISLLVKRAMDTHPYPAVLETEGTTATWVITDVETSYKGHGEAQWIYTVGEQIKKSAVFGFNVDRSLNSPVAETPEAYQTWVDDMIALGAGVEQIAEQVYEATGHYPKVENGYWYVWSVVEEDWVNTNQKAQGEQGIPGVGISSTVLNPDYTLTITFTDGSSYTTPPIRGEKGDTGNGISSTVLNPDYTLTITFTDGTTYTTPSIRGVPGQDYVITSADYDEIASRVDTMIDSQRQQALDDIDDAKDDAVADVSAEGTTQVGLVTAEGTTQVGLVTAKGQEVIQSIPSDYSELSDDVSELKTDFTHKEDWVVGNAEQLLSDNYTEDSEPYIFRKSVSGDREFDEIVGGTIAWNQLVRNGNFESVSVWSPYGGGSYTVSDNVATLTGGNGGRIYQDMPSSVLSHKLLFTADIKGDGTNGAQLYVDGIGSPAQVGLVTSSSWTTVSAIRQANASGIVRMQLYIVSDSTISVNLRNAMCIDLTKMFGSTIADYLYSLETATAGAGVALFRSLFPKPYYAYNPGELKSITGLVSHDTVGFNQFDKTTVVNNSRMNSIGEVISGVYSVSDYIHVVPNKQYYCKNILSGSNGYSVCFYDASKNFVSETYADTGNRDAVSGVVTVPNDARYMRVAMTPSYVDSVCINLSLSGYRNGEYESYIKRTYPLDSSLTLRGIPKLANNKMYFDGDTYESDGTVTRRYGIVDLGTLNWEQYATFATAVLFGFKKVENWRIVPNMICAKYTTTYGDAVAAGADKSIGAYGNQSRLILKDSAYTDAVALKNSLSGQYLVYELATPTTETAQPFQSPQIVDEYGTEEYVYDSEAFPVPVGHVTKYPDNLRKKLDGLPWDLSMIAPVETGTKASQAYAIGKYFLLNNQFCKAKTAIASGATFTLNTNYTVTTIADELFTAINS